MLEHGVHGHEQLAHACGESHLGRFSLAAQMLVEAADHRVATHGSDRGHVQRAAHLRAAAPDDASALVLAAVAIERCNADQRSDLPAAERPKLRQQRQHRRASQRAHAWYRLEQIVLVLSLIHISEPTRLLSISY